LVLLRSFQLLLNLTLFPYTTLFRSISEKMAQRTLCAIPYSPLSLNENYNEIGAIQNTLAYLADNGEDDEEYVTQTAIPLLSALLDRKSTRLNSSHVSISYAVFCLKK